MKEIQNIIFDFGGVIYDIRYENVDEAFARYGVTNLSDVYTKDQQSHEMNLFEMGLITPAEYRDYVRRMTGLPLSDKEVDGIVNAILIDLPAERVDLLRRLRSRYGVYLFSNTNAINYESFYNHTLQKFGFDIFSTCFDAAYFSHTMHCRKPAREGFERIVAEQQLDPEATVFIDDIEKNLQGAREAGLRGLHLSQGTVCDLFDKDLNLSV